MIFVRDVHGHLVNLAGKDLVLKGFHDYRLESSIYNLLAQCQTANGEIYAFTLAEGSGEYCTAALESLERWLERHATIIHPTFGIEPKPEPDEPEGSFAQDDYIDDLPL